jgi:hypothetical protein
VSVFKLGQSESSAEAVAGPEHSIVSSTGIHYYPKWELFIGYQSGHVQVISVNANSMTISGPDAGLQYSVAAHLPGGRLYCLGLQSKFSAFRSSYPNVTCTSRLFGGEPQNGKPNNRVVKNCRVTSANGNFTEFGFAGAISNQAASLCVSITVALRGTV